MNRRKLFFLLMNCCFIVTASAQSTIIINKDLKLEINENLQTKINSTFSNAKDLTNVFSSSEYLVTKYFTAKNFQLAKKEKFNIHTAAGNGIKWKFSGTDNTNQVEKILSVKISPFILNAPKSINRRFLHVG